MEQDESRRILQSVDNVVLILSGKGGVGKSTTAVQLALSLAAAGKKVSSSLTPIHVLHLECDNDWCVIFA